MKLLTFWNVAGLGLGVFGVAAIVDALPNSGSVAVAQSAVITEVSSVLGQLTPNSDSPTSDSLAKLLRIGERTYEVSFDSSVSGEVLANAVVRKIAFGTDMFVSVVTTPSGTYSTDGFASPHVLYPGVSVVETTRDTTELVLKVLIDGEFVDWSTIVHGASNSL